MTRDDAATLAVRVTRCPSHISTAYLALLKLDTTTERDATRWAQAAINNETRKRLRDDRRRWQREIDHAHIRHRRRVRSGVSDIDARDEARAIITEAAEGVEILRTMMLLGCNKNQAGRLHGLPSYAIPNHMRATRRRLMAAVLK